MKIELHEVLIYSYGNPSLSNEELTHVKLGSERILSIHGMTCVKWHRKHVAPPKLPP